ncbi:TIGR03032 family protein [Nocardioides nitrophenolicus]|uniref:TIGR03032 family protein n=1 Tax=Nocardioides nitrophenolicus TaxID=60489 RepID=UPI0019570C62|nr:TIGR03032 family protein [Nocardioides nitrophenolicus]MBM7518201.1 uncharacterized protein (TIGR03032 family) [Nocardioides nitrophenolicus]
MESSEKATGKDAGTPVSWTHSASLPEILTRAGCSLLVSTYQAGQLVAVGVDEGRVHLSFRHFDRAMGVAVDPADAPSAAGRAGPGLTVGSKNQVWSLRSFPGIAPQLPGARYDGCYLPRSSIFTGPIQGHEVVWGRDPDGAAELWLVNTAFSCLVGMTDAESAEHNFVPRWRPPFISSMAAEDRCHLNGLALRDGRPAYVSLMAATDEPSGWRRLPKASGMILDVASGQPVTTGIVMPHSPRWHDGQLYVLNSGMGHLQRVDLASGRREVVAALPGYARGLAVHDGLAFVGLSRIRETGIFGDVPLAEYHDQLKCGFGVIDLASGTTVATFEFTQAVEEIFDVQVLPGVRCAALSGPDTGEIWIA